MTTKTGHETNRQQQLEFGWLPLVTRAVFLRAMIVASVIGSVLTVANQAGWIAGHEPLQPLQLVLVFLTPFAVVTIAQVAGIRQARIDSFGNDAPARPEGFMATAASHGIPARAVTIGLVFGSLTAIIVLTNEFMRSGHLAAVSIAPLAQAYVLPLLFGILSQAISYRRSRNQVVKA